ncbi:HEPN domain-containing protein [Bacillus sp. FJAT-27245]|uniref:ApeA N-terminal domain 1-containing protein n=1 Tax=Bacillus sp. FJAT-27245 TaxID=1684144 RepID=UPI0006A78C0D|nr:HEPN domain-containing protein [Bacillus sp. FJAT-27245]
MNKLDRENIGWWYLPSNPTERLTGTLTIDDDNVCKLKMAHNFGGLSGIGVNELPIIHGVLSNGKEVTLVNSIKTNERWGFPGFPVSVWSSSLAVIGGLYNEDKDIALSEIKATYESLNLWLNKRPFEINASPASYEVFMHYKMPDVIKVENSNFNIEFTYKVNSSGDLYSKFEVIQTEFVRFIFKEKTHYKEGINVVDDFSNFLTLCIGKNVNCGNFFAKDIQGKDIILLLKSQKDNSETVKDHEIIIKFSFIEDSFETCIQTWSAKKELLEPIIHYFVEAHEKGFHVPMSYLKVVQALEAFSRRMRNNKMWSEEEFEEMIERITSQLQDEDDRKLISGIISNEPRLRQRLNEILLEVNDIFEISSKNRKSYINKMVNTRNYYTHFDESLKDKIFKVETMYFITKYLKLVLRVLLLRELGINNDLIKQRMSDNQELISVKEGLGLIPPVELFRIEVKKSTGDNSNENHQDSEETL